MILFQQISRAKISDKKRKYVPFIISPCYIGSLYYLHTYEHNLKHNTIGFIRV